MKANELRIGNWVEGSFGNHYQMDEDDLKRMCVNGMDNEIKLTKEWLIKFGFNYERGKNMWVKGDFGIMLKAHTHFVYKLLVPLGLPCKYYHMVGCAVKNVHQLQNIYFSFTNRELTIV